ncbi:Uncharacterised protein [Serratia entomophila]|nr:Uncharacterised protein [Serratia entomophila]CAI0894141.1 Uncharacterised protein [Serratia entomophila]CAI0899288.1 Uncharacterised protein [Serratia entomophila]CAI0920058.1 Uncharacterised protein [Serratia entomophila]CAI0925309.1 Uncharacterised protein [Serratia entomophila]
MTHKGHISNMALIHTLDALPVISMRMVSAAWPLITERAAGRVYEALTGSASQTQYQTNKEQSNR